MLTAQQSRRIDFLLKYLIPLLFGFLFDLPWFSQVGISVSLVLATYFVGDFVDALLALWQALAVGAVVILIVGLFLDGNLNIKIAAALILFLWFVLIRFLNLRARSGEMTSRNEVVVCVFLITYLLLIAPRGAGENLAFIHHQDNAKQLTAPFKMIEGGFVQLELLDIFDRESVGFFIKFLLAGVVQLQPISGSNVLFAINSVSNAWLFVTGSFFIFMIRILAVSISSLKITGHVIIWFTGLILTVWSFYIVHIAGFLPLSILNTVVVVFLLTVWGFQPDNFIKSALFVFVGASLGMAMFGSWQPWFPLGISAMAVCVYKVAGRSRVRKFVLPLLALGLVLLLFFSVRLDSIISRLDLESFGPAFVPSERLILFGLILATCLSILFVAKISALPEVPISSNKHFFDNFNFGLGFVALVLATFFLRNQNQTFFLAFIVLLLSFSNKSSVLLLVDRIRELSKDERYDGPVLFAISSFSYVVVIYLLSRYIGPNFAPQYAAHKSATAFSAQFFWILIIPIYVLVSDKKYSGRYFALIFFCMIMIFDVNVGFQLEKTSAQWWSLRYRPGATEWWHQSFIKFNQNEKALVVLCSNTSIDSNDYQTYVCNRFSHSLSQDEVAGALRFQQASMSGPSPYAITSIKESLVARHSDHNYIVLFNGAPAEGMKELFALERGSFLEIRSSVKN